MQNFLIPRSSLRRNGHGLVDHLSDLWTVFNQTLSGSLPDTRVKKSPKNRLTKITSLSLSHTAADCAGHVSICSLSPTCKASRDVQHDLLPFDNVRTVAGSKTVLSTSAQCTSIQQ